MLFPVFCIHLIGKFLKSFSTLGLIWRIYLRIVGFGRNNAIRIQAIETSAYPEATFNIVKSIDFSSVTDLGTGFEIEVSGDLTIHGVTRQEQIVLNVSFNGSRILVYGELTPILLANYEIDKPRSAVVLSVDDKATMEFQLYFKKLK